MVFNENKVASKLGVLTIIGIVILLASIPTMGETRIVKQIGGEYNSIQDAIDHASPGDTLRIKEGNYKTHIKIDKAITIIGSSRKNVIIEGQSKKEPIITIKESEGIVRLEELTLTRPDYIEKGMGIKSNNTNVKITNLNISNTNGPGIMIGWGKLKLSNSVIEDNEVGVLSGGNKVSISNCEIRKNNREGLIAAGSGTVELFNTRLSGNSIGIFIYNDNNKVQLKNTTATKNKSGGIQVYYPSEGAGYSLTDLIYSRMTVLTPHSNDSDLEILNSDISDNFSAGIIVDEDTNTQISIENSNVANNKGTGIVFPHGGYATGSSKLIVKESTIEENAGVQILARNIAGNIKDSKIIKTKPLSVEDFNITLDPSSTCQKQDIEDGNPAVNLSSSATIQVSSSNIVNHQGIAIHLEGNSQAILKHTEIRDSSDGIVLEDSAKLGLEDCSTDQNEGIGVCAKENTNAKIYNSEISGNCLGVVASGSSELQINDNNFTENKNYGISLFIAHCLDSAVRSNFGGVIRGEGNTFKDNVKGDVCPSKLIESLK